MVTRAGPSKCGAPPESHQPILVKEWTGPASLSEVVQLWLVKKRWMFTPWKIQTWTVTRTDRCTLSQSFSPDGDKPQERACGTYENDTCSMRIGSPLEDNVRTSLNAIWVTSSRPPKQGILGGAGAHCLIHWYVWHRGFVRASDQRSLIPRMLTPTTAFPVPFVQPPPRRCPCPRLPRLPAPDSQVRSDDKVLLV